MTWTRCWRAGRARPALAALALALALLGACGGGGTKSGADAGGAPDTATGAFATCRGRPFTPAPAASWRHTTTSILVTPAGAANHSAQDVIVAPGAPIALPGKFAYGTISRDLEDEDVQVMVDTCDGWSDLGVHATDSDGRVLAPASLPSPLGPGVYEARFQVLGDGTTTTSFVWVLPVGTRLVVGDIDGTMTESDSQLFMQILDGNHVPVAYPGAVGLTAAHVERGWIFVYLTGRPYWLTQHTRDWLADLAFAPGPLHVTDSNEEAVPTESGVGDFKRAWLQGLLAAGYQIDFAYGNATTDIYAYLGAGIPAPLVWIIGDNAGMMGTNAASGTWEPRVAEVQALSPVAQPFTR